MTWPFSWNLASWSRLWQFNLHYFDWSRDWLEKALIYQRWPDQASHLVPLIDHWISSNPPGQGDGWHSYTLSLRTRNWIWLFSTFPDLVSSSRLESLWIQLCWLESHPEHCHGGNHWLENLISLAIGGLHFEGPRATRMFNRALRLLEAELCLQILADGGHEERSSSYHILLLDRLVELACVYLGIYGECLAWLDTHIYAMTSWALSVRIDGGSLPRFNDSACDTSPSLDDVLTFSQAYLSRHTAGKGLRLKLLNCFIKFPFIPPYHALPLSNPSRLTDLPDTGWTLLRPGHYWELAFKCGTPCPPHLGAHAHSDLLSFDLWHHGQPIISEVGTSTYGSGPLRQYERSCLAHNTLQLGIGDPSSINWLEPVDAWGSFRAGRKARPLNRRSGYSGPWLWASGTHDGYQSINSYHYRWLGCCFTKSNKPVILVVDALSLSIPLFWRSSFHLGPGISPTMSELALHWSFGQTLIIYQFLVIMHSVLVSAINVVF